MPVFYPNKKLPVFEVESPDDIKADSPDGLYIQEGGTSTPSGGTTIHYYDSIGEVPADLPDGSFVAVPSEESAGGGGLSVVELSTEWDGQTSEVVLNANDAAKMDAALAAKMPIVLSITTTEGTEQRFVMSCSILEGVGMFMCYLGVMVSVINMTGSWTLRQQ